MLSPIQDDVKLIQDECKAILGLDIALAHDERIER